MRASCIPPGAMAILALALLGGSASAAGPRLGIIAHVDDGVIIVYKIVEQDGFGAALGLQEGDIIRWASNRMDVGWRVRSIAWLQYVLDRCRSLVVLVYLRDGRKYKQSVKIRWVYSTSDGTEQPNPVEPENPPEEVVDDEP